MSYATADDLLLGDMILSSKLSVTKFIQDSADEIDVRIGRIYETPIVLNPANPAHRMARITLKLANARLASGRLLMAQAQAAQDETLHAYALFLLQEAEAAITAIENNRLVLDGAIFRTDLADTPAPKITNVDSVSPVEAFYTEFMASHKFDSAPIWRPGV